MSMQKIEKNTGQWWDELNHLAELLKEWSTERENQVLHKQVFESMERLGLIVPADTPTTH
ncbi:MAG: hypothetical protein HY648_13390 [Acidobacteria bacterium]|nr:hypothetical protein [Acidobacteriota bacterium]